MYKRYVVCLTDEEREHLEALVRRGKAHARKKLLYARILLKTDTSEAGPAWTDERIADALETSADTVARESGASWRTAWRWRSCPRSPANPEEGSLTAGPRRIWWRWPARSRPRGGRAGPCGFWPGGW